MDATEQKTPYIVELPDDQDEVPAKRSRHDELTTEPKPSYSEVRTSLLISRTRDNQIMELSLFTEKSTGTAR